MTSTTAELNILDGVTSTAAELNILDGVTSTTAEINILDGVTSTAVELNILDGVLATAAELNILDGVLATAAEINTVADGITATAAEVNAICDGRTLTSTDDKIDNFPAGTLMLFQQTAAPTGWTKQTTHNDKSLRVVSGTAGSGGTTNFTTVMSNANTTDSHAITIAQMPAHTHTYKRTVTTLASGSGSSSYHGQTTVDSGSTGGGTGHTHGLDLRIQYVDLIIAAKD